MKAWPWLRYLLPILAIVGLVLGSVAASANAPMTAMASTSASADGMTCCHDKQPVKPVCPKSCPMAAACLAKCFVAIPVLAPRSHVLIGASGLLALAGEYFPP